MLDEFIRYIKKIPAYFWILIFVILIGIFFRTYNFDDWLQFRGDAIRDAELVSHAYSRGVESLPLLGPRAGGTMLRLGPIFYYFQYLSTKIFHNTNAPVFAYPDLFFSILTIPMLFIFSRRYFSPAWSLAISSMLAVSFLAVEYGRFGWNPNSTFFFVLVFSYAILKIFDEDSEKRRIFWAFISGIALAIASQLHFSAFLGMPLVLIIFILWNRKRSKKVLSYKVILTFFISAAIIYTPLFLSEFLKHGENTRQFFQVISEKSSGHGILENIVQAIIMFSKYFLRITLGVIESGKKLILLSGFFCAAGFLANSLLLMGEENKTKRDFLQWSLIMFLIYFLLYIPLAFKIDRPRFFLPLLAMPYLYFAYIIVYIQKKSLIRKYVWMVALAGFGIIMLSNIHSTLAWLSELKASQIPAVSKEKNVKGKNIFLTWSHFQRVASVINSSCEKESPVFFNMAGNIKEYSDSIEYALIQANPYREVYPEKKYRESGPKGCYYYIYLSGGQLPEFASKETFDKSVDAGNIQVMRWHPSFAVKEFRSDKESEGDELSFVPGKISKNRRLFWGDVLYRVKD